MLEYVERLAARLRREEGQTLVEYALIIALVSITLVVALTAMAGALSDVFNFITAELGNAITP